MTRSRRRHRSHFRRLALAGFLVATTIGVGTVAWWRTHANAPNLAERVAAAEHARSAGKLKEAVIAYKNLLRETPDDLLARWRLGETYLAMNAPASALTELERAEPLTGKHPEIALEIIRARIGVGQFQRALVDLAVRSGPWNPEAAALEAEARFGLGHTEDAKNVLTQAAEREPGATSLALALARLALSQHDLDGAANAVERALVSKPEDAEAWLIKGRIALERGRPGDAEAALRASVAHAADKTVGLGVLAEALLLQGKTDDAGAVIAELEKAAPGVAGAHYLRGWLASAKGDWTAAESALAEVLRVTPKHPQALLMLADAELHLNNLQRAEEHLRQFDTTYPAQPAARRLLGVVLLKQQRNKEALELLAPLATGDTRDPGLLSLVSLAYYAAGDTKQGGEYLQKAQQLAPQAPILKAQQALGSLISGNLTGGIADLEALTAASPDNAPPRRLLTYAYLAKGEDQAAVDSATALVRLRPQDPMAYTLLGVAQTKAGQKPAAQASFEKAIALDAKSAPALTNLGLLALADKDLAAGKVKLNAALDADPGYLPATMALAAVADHEGHPDEALRLLEKAAKAAPQAVAPRWELALRRLRRGDYDQAVAAAEAAYALAPGTSSSGFRLGYVQLKAGRSQQAYDTLGALVAAAPDMLPARLLLAEAAHATGRDDVAREHYQTVLAKEPETLEALWGLFALELAQRQYDRAQTLTERLERAMPAAPYGDLATGELAVAKGDHAAAATAFRAAHVKAPSTATVLRLSEVLAAGGRLAEAEDVLARWLVQHPGDAKAHGALGLLALSMQDFGTARVHFEMLLAGAPDDLVALNNLAWLYDKAGDERAMDLAERAHKLRPDSAETADTLGWILVRKGKIELALKLLEQAHKALPAEPNIGYHYARALAAADEKSAARDIVQTALESKASFEERRDAEGLLNELGEK